jgi:hypothetical protein
VEATLIADSPTLLGLLQRGRGKGYRDALAISGASAAAALVECVTNDPRTDRQIESRDEYYGRCAFAIDLDISPIETLLFATTDHQDRDEDRTGLPLGTLGWMARLGRRDALVVVRRYIEVGWSWEWAIGDLAWPTPVGLDGLDEVVSSRCNSIEELARAFPWRLDAVWAEWKRINPRFAEAFALQREWRREQEERRRALRELSTEELLARREISVLRDRTSAADKQVLHEAARGDADQMRHDALKVLGWQRDMNVFDAAEAELRRNPDRDWPPNAGSMALWDLMKVAPIARVRGWLGENGRPGELALHMVALWPTEGDAPLLRSALDDFADDDLLYGVCDVVDGLAKLRDRDAVPQLELIFAETTYSYLRHRAARALAAISTTFAEGLALECLWDCEEQTRTVGCATSSWTSSEARQRLAELAADGLQARRIRSTAARRLRALTV